MKKSSKKFIGTLEVSKYVNGIVNFTDWSSETYNEKQLSYMLTDTPQDLTAMRDLVLANVVPEVIAAIQSMPITDVPTDIVAAVLKVVEEHNIRRGDFAAVLDGVMDKFKRILDVTTQSYNELLNLAIGKTFGTYKEDKPSAYFFEDIRVSDMKEKLEL